MIPNILALWPLIRWVLQALGMMGPEDREKEREFQLRLMAAQQENEAALRTAFAQFQQLWHPAAERVSVWANTAIALFQPALLLLIYWDVVFGNRKSIQVAVDLQTAGIPGLLVMSILLFPFYGPALVSGVASAFQTAVDMAGKRKKNGNAPAVEPSPPSTVVPPRTVNPESRPDSPDSRAVPDVPDRRPDRGRDVERDDGDAPQFVLDLPEPIEFERPKEKEFDRDIHDDRRPR